MPVFICLSAFLSNYKKKEEKGGWKHLKEKANLGDTLPRKTTWGLDQQNKEQMITFTLIALIKPLGLLQE